MPDKRRHVTPKICFGSKIAGLLENSYHKCALARGKGGIWKSNKLKQSSQVWDFERHSHGVAF